MRPDVRKQIVILGTLIAAVAAPTGFIHAGDDPRELPPEVIDSNRDYFAVLYRQTFGADAAGTTFASCRSTDPFIGLYDFYLLKPHSPAAPVLLHFDRDRFVIENYGTVRYFEGQVEVWAARGGNGMSEKQRIVAEPLAAEEFRPAEDVVGVFMIEPRNTCAYAESKFFGRPAVAR